MISSASLPDRNLRPESVPGYSPGVARPSGSRSDRMITANAAFLRAELVRQPEIRPEVVARGRALLADPGYPPPAVISSLAVQILAAPDLSNDES